MANNTRLPFLILALVLLVATTASLASAQEYNIKACYYPLNTPCNAANETCETIRASGSCFEGPESLALISSFKLDCTNSGDNYTALAYVSGDCSGNSVIDFTGVTGVCTTRPALITYNIDCIEVTPSPSPSQFSVSACTFPLGSSCTDGTCETKADGGCFKTPNGTLGAKTLTIKCTDFGASFESDVYATDDCTGLPLFEGVVGTPFACGTFPGLFQYLVNCTQLNIPTGTPSPTPTTTVSPTPTSTPGVVYVTEVDVFDNYNCSSTPWESFEGTGYLCFPTPSEGNTGGIMVVCTSSTEYEYQLFSTEFCGNGTEVGELMSGISGTCSNVTAADVGGAVKASCRIFGEPTASPSLTSSPTPSPTRTPDDGVCFPADGVLSLENGLQKRMDELMVGDRVQVGVNKYSDVYFFGHKLSQGMHDFVQLGLENGRKLELSKSHLVWANKKWKRGEDVKLGDMLLDIVENELVPVASIQIVQKAGLFNPHTLQGDLVVNGIQASSYTEILHPKLAHLLLLPERMLYILNRGISLYGARFETTTPYLLSFWTRSSMSKALFQSA